MMIKTIKMKRQTTAAGAAGPVITRRLPMGFVNVDKPAGWTSHDVVAKVRSLLKSALGVPVKVGHVGTLDPMATGVLPLCIGKATKAAQYLVAEGKTYRAVMKLGERTDTQDATGTVQSRADQAAIDGIDRARVEAVCREFVGPIRQLPPMYSAVKVAGSPLYKAARAGIEVERTPREVVIASLRVMEMDGPSVTIEVDCSKGTYIRTLCADIGDRVGVGAHLARLERLRVGPFALGRAVTLERIEAVIRSGVIEELLEPVDAVLAHLPPVVVDDATADRLCHGAPVTAPAGGAPWRADQLVRIRKREGDVIAIGRMAVESEAAQGRPGPFVIRVDAVLAETGDGSRED
ncbi:MAG: tRNA pseudouridine(55) synthase TruB [Nitrospirae bacterium]|nr:tRNA pseudouridine(55) synthase TruB [Nitrospirota bacterium]